MKILFIHQNFPGQFAHLAAELARRGEEVKALTMRAGPEMPGVDIVRYAAQRGSSSTTHSLVQDFEAKVIRGEACARAAQRLREGGFVPDVIYAHPGWGEALFLKDVFPESKLLGYLEFFYRTEGLDHNFDPEFPAAPEDGWRVQLKNSINLHALHHCDALLAPTQWQRSTYPKACQDRIRVIHEGIDTEVIAPSADARVQLGGEQFGRGDELITFVARNLEPYRGFHVFMRALPAILERHPNARVLVVGGAGVSYGAAPEGADTWQNYMLQELGDRLATSRVFFLGTLNREAFRLVLQVSTVHVYLTYPFVLSWSLLEAMAAECAIVASRTGPVEDVIRHRGTGLLVDFFDPDAMLDAVSELLRDREFGARLGRQARVLVKDRFDLRGRCLPEQVTLLRSLVGS